MFSGIFDQKNKNKNSWIDVNFNRDLQKMLLN